MRSMMVGCLALGLAFASPSRAEAASCDEPVCITGAEGEPTGEWQDGKTLDSKARKKDAKANRKRSDVELKVVVADDRGSVFVDGRYLADGDTRTVKPGKHEIEVREGEQVIILGVVVIPRDSDAVVVAVNG